MISPVWLLDVDGVLNATRPGWGAAPRSGIAVSDGVAYRIRWAPALVSRLRALHSSGLVVMRWCTTWCADAEQIERLFGLPPLERAWTHPISSVQAPAVKLAAARAVVAEGRRLIWTDDEVVPVGGPVFEELSGNGLLIAPKPGRGLQPEHLDAIEAFCSL
ncbi:hypothetical protein [Actinoplanes hulinensis]|uniref:hypothetical protein n=1 Tax=Actinoplanes hulinensis TaxID=1144547 RepID=UPI0027E30A67|nr:hypothetical protein [Actinoplanes hulinensis]